MTIEFRGKPGPTLPFTATDTHLRKSAQSNGESTASRGPAADTLTVTGPAAMLQRTANVANEETLVDVSRVESIRRELARGHYEPDMARVAEKLVSFERALRL